MDNAMTLQVSLFDTLPPAAPRPEERLPGRKRLGGGGVGGGGIIRRACVGCHACAASNLSSAAWLCGSTYLHADDHLLVHAAPLCCRLRFHCVVNGARNIPNGKADRIAALFAHSCNYTPS